MTVSSIASRIDPQSVLDAGWEKSVVGEAQNATDNDGSRLRLHLRPLSRRARSSGAPGYGASLT